MIWLEPLQFAGEVDILVWTLANFRNYKKFCSGLLTSTWSFSLPMLRRISSATVSQIVDQCGDTILDRDYLYWSSSLLDVPGGLYFFATAWNSQLDRQRSDRCHFHGTLRSDVPGLRVRGLTSWNRCVSPQGFSRFLVKRILCALSSFYAVSWTFWEVWCLLCSTYVKLVVLLGFRFIQGAGGGVLHLRPQPRLFWNPAEDLWGVVLVFSIHHLQLFDGFRVWWEKTNAVQCQGSILTRTSTCTYRSAKLNFGEGASTFHGLGFDFHSDLNEVVDEIHIFSTNIYGGNNTSTKAHILLNVVTVLVQQRNCGFALHFVTQTCSLPMSRLLLLTKKNNRVSF